VLRIKCSETSGITILLIGTALLLTTFAIASIHLQGDINVLPVPSLLSFFGEAFSPLIEATLRVLYLGMMGWIATIVTTKGLNVILHAKLLDKDSLNS
jgi:hypothetical protein